MTTNDYKPAPCQDAGEAFSQLDTAAQLIRLARLGVQAAIHGLEGARGARADELAAQLADVQAFAERLAFVVEGDLRADQALEAAVSRHPAGRAK